MLIVIAYVTEKEITSNCSLDFGLNKWGSDPNSDEDVYCLPLWSLFLLVSEVNYEREVNDVNPEKF